MNEYEVIKAWAREMRKKPTPAEARLWKALRGKNLNGYKFMRQHRFMYSPSGKKTIYFIMDFYRHKKKLCIELDGPIHNRQLEYDLLREKTMKEVGVRTIRFSNDRVLNDLKGTLQQIRLTLDEL